MDPRQLYYILEWRKKDSSALVGSTIVQCFIDIVSARTFHYKFPGKYNPIYGHIDQYLLGCFQRNDAGEIAILSDQMDKIKGRSRQVLHDTILQASLEALQLPGQIETYYALSKVLQPKNKPQPPSYNHPPSFSNLARVQDSSRVVIKTDKGEIVMQLYHKDAPATVANFIDLIESKFYDGKTFHRVVPNFVVQGGCPRGDGYGSKDYTIRTEVSELKYDRPGRVGMASAGPDTEGTQFFITHRPTPHLDGKYTIFAQVESGHTVVQLLQPGDKILTARLR